MNADDLALIEDVERRLRDTLVWHENSYSGAWPEHLKAMRDALQCIALARAGVAAREDTARLDWLESAANERGGILLHDGTDGGRLGIGLRPGFMSRSLRAAIDAARNAKGESDE